MRKLNLLSVILLSGFVSIPCLAQDKSLVNTSASPAAKLYNVNMGDVRWGNGFWGERFRVCQDSMIPQMWKIFNDPSIAHSYRNFEIAAGLEKGQHAGPPFQDGDFYKWFEGVAAVYAVTKDPQLDQLMDKIIKTIALAQRKDGYIHTPELIDERNNGNIKSEFKERLNFETYNMGHLMTAACVHYRATGKTSLLDVAKKSADYLYNFYRNSPTNLAYSAICPSHYMGVIEMYRTTRDPRYLELAKNMINIRSLVINGTDDNQDRIPFRKQTKAMGHAVRANYLYAGVADVYAETGDDSLFRSLNLIWNDVTHHKMYVTGACGALYDGTSPDGTSYEPSEVQKVHQAYGRDYQLPNQTAHNETCANISNMLWNWRMLELAGEAKYADIVELTLYNSILSGISLSGKEFFYTNPLCVNKDVPFKLRWSKQREQYIKLCNCCPPNVVRTVAEVNNYVYSLSDNGLYFNLYGSNTLSTVMKDGSSIKLKEETDYPWDGKITVSLDEVPDKLFSIFLRIPGWCNKARIFINGKDENTKIVSGEYTELKEKWTKGDKIELLLDMPVTLVEANPLVEEARNQVAVKRGPVVYCLESVDMNKDKRIFNVTIPEDVKLTPKSIDIDGSRVVCLEGKADYIDDTDWKDQLYKQVGKEKNKMVPIRLIPYYAWDNRGQSEMTVWIPLKRK